MPDMPLPQTVIVELTNQCNLRCPLCSTAIAMRRPRGFMSDELFAQLADDAGSWDPLPEFAFTMCGEPLLHPRACDYVALAAQRSLRCSISTNATTLTGELAERLILAGPTRVFLCVDGFSAQTHEAYRRGSCFEHVKAHCEEFLALRERHQARQPEVIIQTLVTSLNEEELPQIERWATAIGADALYLKTLSLGTHLTSEQQDRHAYLLPRSSRYRRAAGERTGLCRRPETQMIVYWDGAVGLCCRDFNDECAIGMVAEHGGLAAQFRSTRSQRVRRRATVQALPLCRRCHAPDASRGAMIRLNP